MPQSLPANLSPPPALSQNPKRLHSELRESVAMIYALEKVAQSALDEGEFPPEELDNLCVLITRLRSDLEAIKAALAEMATGGSHE